MALPAAPAEGQALHPRWSPDGNLMAYDRAEGPDVHLWVVGPDGLPLRATRGPGVRSHPTWSPDAGRIAFAASLPGEDPDLWILDVETGDLTRVTRSPERETEPSWSPDGERLAFVAPGAGGRADLWTVGVDGLGLRRLTDSAGEDEGHPAWSGDRALLYDVAGGGSRWVARLDLESGTRTALTDPARHGDVGEPAPTPDGTGLVVVRPDASGGSDLWRMELAGGALRRLTEMDGKAGGTSLSPDGSMVAFHAGPDGDTAVYLLRLASGEVVRVAGP